MPNSFARPPISSDTLEIASLSDRYFLRSETLFLKSFLEDVLIREDVNETLLEHTNVMKEYVIDHDRRIDIVIQNVRFQIPIEVTIYADEQEGQCFDYYETAKNAPLVYLTRFGDSPSSYSRKKKGSTELLPLNHIHCISWEDDICGWLTKLLAKLNEPVKSVVMQYIDTIHVFADERNERLMERSLEVLYESPDYFGAGIEIEKSMKTAKLGLMRLVFDDFKEGMKTGMQWWCYDQRRKKYRRSQERITGCIICITS